jgi:hypothetical protein
MAVVAFSAFLGYQATNRLDLFLILASLNYLTPYGAAGHPFLTRRGAGVRFYARAWPASPFTALESPTTKPACHSLS